MIGTPTVVYSYTQTAIARTGPFQPEMLGLGPGSSSQYSMYRLRHMPVQWTRPVHLWSRRSRDPCPPRAGEGGSPEAPPEGPAGGTLPEAICYKSGNDERDRRLEVVKLITALSYCVGSSFHFFCVPAFVLLIGLTSLLSDACQRRNFESWLGGVWVDG